MKTSPHTLYLIPVPIASGADPFYLDPALKFQLGNLRHFIVENEKSARAFLKRMNPDVPVQDYVLQVFDEHSDAERASVCAEVLRTHDAGLLSEAGCPCIADPGAAIVAAAHRMGVRVRPLIGPSSILLALIGSGLNGQNFAFHGYLPQDSARRLKRISELERRSDAEGQTQIFMDTPYRNQNLLNDVLSVCHPQTRLCIASDLTASDENILTLTIQEWKNFSPRLPKSPALFLLQKIR